MWRIIAIALLCVAAAALGLRALDGPKVAAVVGDDVVTVSDLQERIGPLMRTTAFVELSGQMSVAKARRMLQRTVLTEMIRERVLDEAARELSVEVTSAEVRAGVRRIRRDLELRTREDLRKRITASGLSPAAWRRSIEYDVLEEKLRERLTELATPPEAELREYYGSHLDEFTLSRVQHIVVWEKALAERLHRRLRAVPGRDADGLFARLARRHSRDPSSKDRSGDLGFVRDGSFRLVLPGFDDIVAELETGQMSRPARTRQGFHIVRVLARKPAPFDDVREEIAATLMRPKDPYLAFLAEAYDGVDVAERFGELDPSYRIVPAAR